MWRRLRKILNKEEKQLQTEKKDKKVKIQSETKVNNTNTFASLVNFTKKQKRILKIFAYALLTQDEKMWKRILVFSISWLALYSSLTLFHFSALRICSIAQYFPLKMHSIENQPILLKKTTCLFLTRYFSIFKTKM